MLICIQQRLRILKSYSKTEVHDLRERNIPFFRVKLEVYLLNSRKLSYILYVFVFWFSYLIPPNISFKQETIGYAQSHVQTAMIDLMLQDFSDDVDPFRKQQNIITPHLYTVIDTAIIDKPLPLFSTQEKSFPISFKNVTLVLNHVVEPYQGHQEMKQYLIVLQSCSNHTLQDNSYCADQKTIDDYLSKFQAFLFLSIKLNQLNHATRELEEFNNQYYYAFDIFKPQYSQVMLKQQRQLLMMVFYLLIIKATNSQIIMNQLISKLILYFLLMLYHQYQNNLITLQVLDAIYLDQIVFKLKNYLQCQDQDNFLLRQVLLLINILIKIFSYMLQQQTT